jgi:hypothetical protein
MLTPSCLLFVGRFGLLFLLLFQKKQWVAPEIQLTYISLLLESLECDFYRGSESQETLLVLILVCQKKVIRRETDFEMLVFL